LRILAGHAEQETATSTRAARHRVVIVGFGGLLAAKSLARVPDLIAVTLINRTNHELFRPLLYRVATRTRSAGQIANATPDVLSKKNISVERSEAIGSTSKHDVSWQHSRVDDRGESDAGIAGIAFGHLAARHLALGI
jgi:hypothetical protein